MQGTLPDYVTYVTRHWTPCLSPEIIDSSISAWRQLDRHRPTLLARSGEFSRAISGDTTPPPARERLTSVSDQQRSGGEFEETWLARQPSWSRGLL